MKNLFYLIVFSLFSIISCSENPTDYYFNQNGLSKTDSEDPIMFWELNSGKDMYWHFNTPVIASGNVFGTLNGSNVNYPFSSSSPHLNAGRILPEGFVFQSYEISYYDPNITPWILWEKSGPINEDDLDLYDYFSTFRSRILSTVPSQTISRWSTLNLYLDILQPERFNLTIQIFKNGNLFSTIRNNQLLIYTWGNGWQRIKRIDNNFTFNQLGNYEVRFTLTSNYVTSIKGPMLQFTQTMSSFIVVAYPS